MTVRWFTDADRAEQARIVRERLERDRLFWEYVQWLEARAGHGGPFLVPRLPPETETRLIELLRRTDPPETGSDRSA